MLVATGKGPEKIHEEREQTCLNPPQVDRGGISVARGGSHKDAGPQKKRFRWGQEVTMKKRRPEKSPTTKREKKENSGYLGGS